MLNYQLVQTVKTVFGSGSSDKIGEILKEGGINNVFIVCDKGIVKAGITDRITKALEKYDIKYFVFDKALPDAPAEIVEEGDKLYKQNQCKAMIAIGGGSTIDTAKGINILQYNDGPILRFTDFSTPRNQCKWLIAVPTTAGTGSELSDGLVLSDPHGMKMAILAPKAMCEYSVLDPELTLGLPPELTATTGFDALAHAIESYTSTAANIITDQITEGIIRSIIKWLPIAVNDGKNIEARSHMIANATLSGWMLGYGHTHAGHSVAHVLGSEFGIPHGFACAYALPKVLEYNATVIPEKTSKVAEFFGVSTPKNATPEDIGKLASKALDIFINSIHIRKANSFEVDKSKFSVAAKETENEGFQVFNPRKMSSDDALKILNDIFK